MSSIPNSPDVCPIDSDETAEAYITERLSPADALHFENHCATCRPCAAAAKEAEWFVRALRGAAQKLRAEPPAIDGKLWSQAWPTRITRDTQGGVYARLQFSISNRGAWTPRYPKRAG
jgi:anti-sigma factor RsiW